MVWETVESSIWVTNAGSKRCDGTYNSAYFGTDSGHYLWARFIINNRLWFKTTDASHKFILYEKGFPAVAPLGYFPSRKLNPKEFEYEYKRIGQIWRFAGKNYPDAVRRACFRQTQAVQGVHVPYSGFPRYSSDLISEHTIVRAGLIAKEVAVFESDTSGARLTSLANIMPKEIKIKLLEKPGMAITDDIVKHFQLAVKSHHYAVNWQDFAKQVEVAALNTVDKKWTGLVSTQWGTLNDDNPSTILINQNCATIQNPDPFRAFNVLKFIQSLCSFFDLKLMEVRVNRPVKCSLDYYYYDNKERKVEIELIFDYRTFMSRLIHHLALPCSHMPPYCESLDEDCFKGAKFSAHRFFTDRKKTTIPLPVDPDAHNLKTEYMLVTAADTAAITSVRFDEFLNAIEGGEGGVILYQELARFVDIVATLDPCDPSSTLLWETIDLDLVDPIYRQMFALIRLHFMQSLPTYIASSRHEIRTRSQYKSRLEYLAKCADLEIDIESLNPGVKPEVYVLDPVQKPVIVDEKTLDQVTLSVESQVEMEEVKPLKNDENYVVADSDVPLLENEDDDSNAKIVFGSTRSRKSSSSDSSSSSSASPPTTDSSSPDTTDSDEGFEAILSSTKDQGVHIANEIQSSFVARAELEPESGYETFDSAPNSPSPQSECSISTATSDSDIEEPKAVLPFDLSDYQVPEVKAMLTGQILSKLVSEYENSINQISGDDFQQVENRDISLVLDRNVPSTNPTAKNIRFSIKVNCVDIPFDPPEYQGYLDWNSVITEVKEKIVDPFTPYEIENYHNRRKNRTSPYGNVLSNRDRDGGGPRYNIDDGWWSTGLYEAMQESPLPSYQSVVLGNYFRTSENTKELEFIMPGYTLRHCRLTFCLACREKRVENGLEKGKPSDIDSKCLWNVTEIVDDMVQTIEYPEDKIRTSAKFFPSIEVNPPIYVEGTRKIKMKKFTSDEIIREHEKLKSISDSRGGGLDLSKPSGLIGNLDLELTADVKDWDTQCQYSKLEKEFRNKASSYGSNRAKSVALAEGFHERRLTLQSMFCVDKNLQL